MNRSPWQNPLSTQAETGLITGVDITLVGMAVAVPAVFARGPPVPAGSSMLASSREFIKDLGGINFVRSFIRRINTFNHQLCSAGPQATWAGKHAPTVRHSVSVSHLEKVMCIL